jgi:hypothetical protein
VNDLLSRTGHGDQTYAVLVSSVPVQLVDISRGGCRIGAPRWMPVGTTGLLQVEIDGAVCSDDIRVSRCQPREGAGPVFHLGVELLRTRRLTRHSLRLAVRTILGDQRAGALPARDEEPDPATEERRDERRKGISRAPPLALVIPR